MSTKVWVYQSSKAFNEGDKDLIRKRADEFLTEWNNHGKNISAEYRILYDRFFIFIVDEAKVPASGCSIDSSVRFVKQLEKDLGLDLMNRMKLAYRSGNEIKIAELNEFKEMVKAHKIGEETIVFNNLVSTLDELNEKWEVPLKDSWHKQFLS